MKCQRATADSSETACSRLSVSGVWCTVTAGFLSSQSNAHTGALKKYKRHLNFFPL